MRRWLPGIVLLVAAPLLLSTSGCLTDAIKPPMGREPVAMTMEITAYCNCGKCCGWQRSWFGLGPPVISSGVNKGKPKQVGLLASRAGGDARRGRRAADPAARHAYRQPDRAFARGARLQRVVNGGAHIDREFALVIFDRDSDKSWDERIFWRTVEQEHRTIHIVGA